MSTSRRRPSSSSWSPNAGDRRRRLGGSLLDSGAAHRALNVWRRLGLIRYAASPVLERVWELRAAITAYDAMYVALAENLDCALVTADTRLPGANGPRCAITVVPW
ncbi:type II toxin-antitoxin system VapC family toxin [Mycolicibacterium frederiksbergense]|uniref:type II toxin-antitoxin system VapC family toxin n=1 Tax=Mycolicibacterium frederiksbergense TaxID=117567 RepID=UPI003557F0E0